MVATMLALAGCGKEETPEEKFKSELQDALEDMEKDFEEAKKEHDSFFFEEEPTVSEEVHTEIVIPYLREQYPDISIGDAMNLEKADLSGETLTIGNRVSFTIPEDWVVDSTNNTSVYCDYKGNSAVESYVGLNFLFEKAVEGASYTSREAFDQHIIDLITFQHENSYNRFTTLSPITINGYDGYYYELDRSSTSMSDNIYMDIYMDGAWFTITIAYFNDTDPAIKEAGIASAMEVARTLTAVE